MLLRESGRAVQSEVELASTVGGTAAAGVEHGDLLAAYAEAANVDAVEARRLDDRMLAAVGPGGLVDAAVSVAIFNGLVRSADATGIPLDDDVMAATVGGRDALGLNGYGGAANSYPAC